MKHGCKICIYKFSKTKMVEVRNQNFSILLLDSSSGWSGRESKSTTATPLYQLTTHRMLQKFSKPIVDQKLNHEGNIVKGSLEDYSALKMFSLVRPLPLNFISNRLPGNFEYNFQSFRKDEDDDEPEPRYCCNGGKTESHQRRYRRDSTKENITKSTTETSSTSRKTVTKKKMSTLASPIEITTAKQYEEGDSESALRKEIARMNLDVLKRLANMLGEEREKYAAERQMLSASRDMMRAETRKVISERIKLDAERQKVDLERDVLQSQLLGRNFLRNGALTRSNPAVGF